MNRTKDKPSAAASEPQQASAWRETIESLAVALILALLFRGFVAEAFIIPTGSMAPSLMGSHKDIYCPECGSRYQAGASIENGDQFQQGIVIASVCDNCRHENVVQLEQQSDSTFSGDRIMVSKFSYAIGEPKRWDVIVFKCPYNAKQNFIKRLIGLPGETISIRHGDLFRKLKDQPEEILRKPDDKLLAMRHLVFDTRHQARSLVAAKYPSRWQPWHADAKSPPDDSWQVTQGTDGEWSATLATAEPELRWLRYFHNLPTDTDWRHASGGRSLAGVDPFRGGAVSDFYAYNSSEVARPMDLMAIQRIVREQGNLAAGRDIGIVYPVGTGGNGIHWVGDLMLETSVRLDGNEGALILDLVEAGRHYQCEFELETGEASLWQWTDQERKLLAKGEKVVTKVRGSGTYNLRFANCDDELRVWVNGARVAFADSTYAPPPTAENVPRYAANDPLDAAPACIGVRGAKATVEQAILYRDKYYTAVKGTTQGTDDYVSRYAWPQFEEVRELLRTPAAWETSNAWSDRRTTVEFPLEDEQYLPMGDNSPESQDSRCWSAPHYVHRDMLTGQALMVFWPHPWYYVFPNLSRMGFIR